MKLNDYNKNLDQQLYLNILQIMQNKICFEACVSNVDIFHNP